MGLHLHSQMRELSTYLRLSEKWPLRLKRKSDFEKALELNPFAGAAELRVPGVHVHPLFIVE